MEFSRMLEKMKQNMEHTAQAKEEFDNQPQLKVNIMYDKSLKDVGVMIKMNSLMKRLELIKFVVGDWKTDSKNYQSITELIKYLQRKMEILDEAKIVFLTKRAEFIRQEVVDLLQAKSKDADVIKQKELEMGANKEVIEHLYTEAKGVKNIQDSIP